MKQPFTFEGAPHRPLQRVFHSPHMQGLVASTGPSAVHKVAEGLRIFGGKGFFSPKEEHWKSLLEKYSPELALLAWLNGHIPRKSRGGSTKKPVDYSHIQA